MVPSYCDDINIDKRIEQHSWPLDSESSSVCQTYYDIKHPRTRFYRSISKTTSPVAERLALKQALALLTYLGCRGRDKSNYNVEIKNSDACFTTFIFMIPYNLKFY